MNRKLENYAREELKLGLAQLEEKHHDIFRSMYAPDQDLKKPIFSVVDDMPMDKLDWAMQQVDRTLEKLRGHNATD